jgi:hypothetical protein
MLATPVVALAGIALGVLVGEHRALRLQHPGAGIVLGRNQLDVVLLTAPLSAEGGVQCGIKVGNRQIRSKHREGT